MSDFPTLHTESHDRILSVTVRNPPLNLIDAAFVRDLRRLLDLLEDDPGTRVVVFRSADPDFFLPHVDMVHIPEYTAEAARSGGPDDVSLGALFRRLSEARQVTIAVIEGRARGAGSEFALATDMRFISRERGRLGQPEAGVGVFPGAGAVQHISRLVGRGNAMEVLLGADDWGGDEAERIGLVNRSLADADLMEHVDHLAERIAGFPEAAVRLIKRRINAVTLPPKEDVQVDAGFFQTLARDEESRRRQTFMLGAGLQTRSRAELEFGAVVAEYEPDEQ